MEFDENIRSGRTKLSTSQFGLMVDFISLNPELAGGKFSEKCTRADIQEKWEEMAVLLNADKTGCQKTWERWKKSWIDMKMKIKQKMGKLNSSGPYMVEVNDIERKAWKLMCAARQTDALDTLKSNKSIPNSNTNHVKYRSILVGNEYTLLNFDDDKSEIKPSEMSPVNGVSNENNRARLQDKDVLEKPRTKNISEESLDECSKLSKNRVMTSEESADPETEHIYDEGAAANHENDVVNIEPTAQKSSNNFSRKRLKTFNHRLWKRRKQEELSIKQLLQKQNELLERIAGSIARVEKAVVTNSSQQSEKNEIQSVHDNIGKIAECFGSVSMSLKKMVQK